MKIRSGASNFQVAPAEDGRASRVPPNGTVPGTATVTPAAPSATVCGPLDRGVVDWQLAKPPALQSAVHPTPALAVLARQMRPSPTKGPLPVTEHVAERRSLEAAPAGPRRPAPGSSLQDWGFSPYRDRFQRPRMEKITRERGLSIAPDAISETVPRRAGAAFAPWRPRARRVGESAGPDDRVQTGKAELPFPPLEVRSGRGNPFRTPSRPALRRFGSSGAFSSRGLRQWGSRGSARGRRAAPRERVSPRVAQPGAPHSAVGSWRTTFSLPPGSRGTRSSARTSSERGRSD